MPLATLQLPFGLRDVKLRPIDAAGAVGASVDLPYGRTLHWGETEDYTELRGDDKTVAYRGRGPSLSWELEAGGIDVAAYKLMSGGTLTASGTTPNMKQTLNKKTSDARPYFQAEGQAINDTGGDSHILLYKLRVTGDLEGEFGDGQFFLTAGSGVGIGDASNNLWDFVENETAVAIT